MKKTFTVATVRTVDLHENPILKSEINELFGGGFRVGDEVVLEVKPSRRGVLTHMGSDTLDWEGKDVPVSDCLSDFIDQHAGSSPFNLYATQYRYEEVDAAA